ncbi:MAG: LytR C-terminal domain-containing protein [Dermatophilaceae bacterium]
MNDNMTAHGAAQDAERQRRRSIAILVSLGGFLVVAFLVAFAVVQGWIPTSSPGSSEAVSSPTSSCSTAQLPAVSSITVNVYNGTDRAGLAGITARTLREQGFVVAQVGNDPLGKQVAGVAEIRYGTEGEAQAQTLALRLPGATMAPDGRKGGTVDVAVGEGFTAVGTPTASSAGTTC